MPTIEQMIEDLKTAGWIAKTSYIWKAPHGTLYAGPAGAWKCMKAIQDNPVCPTLPRIR